MNSEISMMIVAGEASGETHGAALAKELLRRNPYIRLFGIGGKQMANAGVTLKYTVNDLGVTGFTEVIARLPIILKAMRWCLEECKSKRPIAAILIDYPDFNLRLAKKLKKLGIRVIYYISPQMWAWRSGRVKIVQEIVDRMLVIFPFEKRWYQSRGVDVCYVGHPLVEKYVHVIDRETSRKNFQVADHEILLAVLPGSRTNEIERMLPVFLESIKKLSGKIPALRCVLPLASTLERSYIESYIGENYPYLEIFEGDISEILPGADFAWVTSGTATLDVALSEVPMVIVYKTSLISYWLAKMLIDIPFIGMLNLVAGKEIAPELIQNQMTSENLILETMKMIDSPILRKQKKDQLRELKVLLGLGGASRNAANEIFSICGLDEGLS